MMEAELPCNDILICKGEDLKSDDNDGDKIAI